MKITLVYDVNGWAWHRRALDLLKYAPSGADIVAVDQHHFSGALAKDTTRHLFYFSWMECPPQYMSRAATLLANHGCEYEPWHCRKHNLPPTGEEFWPAVASTRQRNRTAARNRFPKFRKMICLTPQLVEVARQLGGTATCVPTGIDHSEFFPRDPLNKEGPLRVGWCGQIDSKFPLNQKGYQWVFEPLKARVQDEYSWQVNTRSYVTALERQQMQDWYNSIDVFLCTSISEGTPTTAMEAMMCGRPVVTTDVGDMVHLVETGFNGIRTGSYSDRESADRVIENSISALAQFAANRALLFQCGFQARERMLERRNWKDLAIRWLTEICS